MKETFYDGTPWGSGDAPGQNRLQQRSQNMFGNNAELLEGKRVLDLACNNGRMAYGALSAGAAHVTGVEARSELIEDGEAKISDVGASERMTFVQSDLFEYLENAEPGQFDVILCLGFLYHTVKHADFFRACARLRPETVIVDTSVVKNFWFGRKNFGKAPALFLADYEDPDETRNTTDLDGIVYWPSCSFLEEMLRRIRYAPKRIPYTRKTVSDWSAMHDYRQGLRASYIGRRVTSA